MQWFGIAARLLEEWSRLGSYSGCKDTKWSFHTYFFKSWA